MKGTKLVASFRVMEVENGYLLSIEEAGAGGEPQRIYNLLPRTWYFKELKQLAEGVLADVAKQFLEDQEQEARRTQETEQAILQHKVWMATNPSLVQPLSDAGATIPLIPPGMADYLKSRR